MRLMIASMAFLSFVGCSGIQRAGSRPTPAPVHKTPVSRDLPSISRHRAEQRLRQGEEVVGKTEVQGSLVR